MPLVSSTEMLLRAQKGHYAVGAFNIENMEMALAVLNAAQQANAPVIVQTTPGTVAYANTHIFAAMVGAMAESFTIPVALQLDHGNTLELVGQALESGYPAVMYDGSSLPFDQNIFNTRLVVKQALMFGVSVEAELGTIGGKEDTLAADSVQTTDPEEAAAFAASTGIHSLAVAIGTAHGFYHGTPVLDKERLQAIRAKVSIPLVLHGASGLPDSEVRQCIRLGICKVNFATELRVAYTQGVKEALLQDPRLYDPKQLGRKAKEHIRDLVAHKIDVCGCGGKAV